ncbi:hypothetical protein [Halococcoides cellulosivorans]|uniref:hypothetical protein n=1 Tax=Halococcoides cellulosivorans TaxID=1679096 RepID=UPI00131EE17E|nr:hypothetical protein [Halococcoides cellulosivorans]
MTVEIQYTIGDEVKDVNDVRGGLNIFVNGRRVVQYQEEDPSQWRHSWEPKFAGEYLHTVFSGLVKRAISLSKGDVKIYQENVVKFGPTVSRLILEPLSDSDLRLAHRVTGGSVQEPPLPVSESARGYVVDRCEFSQAVSDAAHDYLADVRAFPLEWGEDLLEEFETALDELDKSLVDCANNTPSLQSRH